jgi:hypothetical protein
MQFIICRLQLNGLQVFELCCFPKRQIYMYDMYVWCMYEGTRNATRHVVYLFLSLATKDALDFRRDACDGIDN